MKQEAILRNARAEQGRQYMKRIVEAQKRVSELTERIEQCHVMIRRCGAVMDMKQSLSPTPESTLAGIECLVRLKEQLGEAMEGYAARVREAENAIEALEDPLERTLLRQRYLCGKTMERITTEMHYTDARYVRKLMAQALSHLHVS